MKETIDFLYDQVRSLQKRVETLEKENAELESAYNSRCYKQIQERL